MNKFDSIKTQKLDFNDSEQALEILKRFKKKYLHDNIDELQYFSFWDILADIEFNDVSFDGNFFDGDRTRIVYAIDKLLYENKQIPEFKLKINYTGDTINTFRTLFGNRFQNILKKNGEEIVEEKFKFSTDQINLKNDFFRVYQRIGNFYILPTVTGKSINSIRGRNRWKDYFDVFLQNMDKYFKNSPDTDKNLYSYLKADLYQSFFEQYKSRDNSIETFCEDFYLDEYKNLDYKHPNKDWLCGHNKYSERYVSQDDYKIFAFNYISKATELINNRSNTIVEILKEKYPELK